ncbi:hypothetical protein [Nitrospira sp. Nam74]
MDVQKPVKEFLRAADIILDRLRSGHPFSGREVMMLQTYNTRIAASLAHRVADETHLTSNRAAMPAQSSE